MIADDLSGACDTGVEFLNLTGKDDIIVDADDMPASGMTRGLAVLNTESRCLSAEQARRKVGRAATWAAALGAGVLFKKRCPTFLPMTTLVKM